MEKKLNYKALAISLLAAAPIFGYMLMEAGKLDDAVAAGSAKKAELASER